MVKVDVLRLPSRALQTKAVRVEEGDVVFEIELRELTALQELEASSLAAECQDMYPGGVNLGEGVGLANATPRAWLTACRLSKMQTQNFYSPEEFLAIFHKLPNVATALFSVVFGSWGDDEKKEPAPKS